MIAACPRGSVGVSSSHSHPLGFVPGGLLRYSGPGSAIDCAPSERSTTMAIALAQGDPEATRWRPSTRDRAASARSSYAGRDELRRLHLAIMSMGSELDFESVLNRFVEAAVELVGARYGAVGVFDEDRSRFTQFAIAGVDRESETVRGELPQELVTMGVSLNSSLPLRLIDRHAIPGDVALPTGVPVGSTLLVAPVFVGGNPFGNVYLTEKCNGETYTDIDQEVVVALVAAAGLAIEKARLHERLSRIDVIEDRERIARDLHDTVIQRVFATGLLLQSTLRLVDSDPEISNRIDQAIDELDQVVSEVRTTVFELHVAAASHGGMRRQLLQLGDEMSSALGFRPTFQFDGPVDTLTTDEVAPHLLAAVGEALVNIAKHAHSPNASVLVTATGTSLCALVDDDGVGPGNPRSGGQGLANLTNRAGLHGGTSSLEARPAGGSRLRWQIAI